MAFVTDQQTLNDLGIFGRVGRSSVYDLFKAKTRGGAAVLREMFNYPLESAREINRRGAVIRYLQEREIEFPFMAEWFNAFEYYLSNRDQRTRLAVEGNTLGHRMRELSGREREYSLLQKGVLAGIRIVKGTELLLQSMAKVGVPEEYRERYEQITEMLRDSNLSWALSLKNPKKLPYARMADYDISTLTPLIFSVPKSPLPRPVIGDRPLIAVKFMKDTTDYDDCRIFYRETNETLTLRKPKAIISIDIYADTFQPAAIGATYKGEFYIKIFDPDYTEFCKQNPDYKETL